MDKTVPPGRVKGTLTPPCSKSYAQRALAAALLSEEVSVLRNIEFCDDTRSALQCIETLGARVRRVDPTSLSIEGGLSPKGCVLNVGESGLSTRLFTPVASLCPTPVTIEGRGSLLRRPMQMMFEPLRRLGVRNIQLAGPGAYARTIPRELLVKIMHDPEQRADFLDFCYRFDANPYVCGLGKDNLFAMGEV